MKLVFDATLLIYFSKMKILDKVTKLKGEKIIPSGVYFEVVDRGKIKGKDDALFVEKLVSEGLFSVESPETEDVKYFLELPRVRKGDAETLALAGRKNAVAIIDESNLRTIAEANKIEHRGSIFILFEMYRQKIINKKDIRKYLDEMIRLGWRCSTELYASVLTKIGEL